MTDHDRPHAINQKIFQMGLPVETVSVYLLCCGLAEAGTSLSLSNLMDVWNGTPDQLRDGLKALEARNVLLLTVSDPEDNSFYRLLEDGKWKCH
jgi:hypothetical protein